ncbi:MAG: DUF1318 domain-containing protein [Leptospiraceae bacterium]|nr:DUF1318 domain-containing protein [Leptospiraceae bacterium]
MKLSLIMFSLIFLGTLNCTLRVPAFTLTQAQTAAEKQLIGEEKELEKDGWIISSIKSSSSGPDDWKKDSLEEFDSTEEKKEFYSNLKVIAYTANTVKKLKSYGVVGEGLDGRLKFLKNERNPKYEKEFNKEERMKLEETIELVNEARKKVEIIETKKNINNKQRYVVEQGEFFETSAGKWESKN